MKEIISGLPAVIGYSEYNMGWKLRVMAILTEGDRQEMVGNARRFMFSARKLVERASALKRAGQEWRHNPLIFANRKYFDKKYAKLISEDSE